MAEKKSLSADQQKKIMNIMLIRSGVSTLGFVGGLGLAYKQKKGFWGYVGFGLLGSLVFGSLAYVGTLPAVGKVLASTATDDKKKPSEETIVKIVTGRKKLGKLTPEDEKKFIESLRNITFDEAEKILSVYGKSEKEMNQADKDFVASLKQKGVFIGG